MNKGIVFYISAVLLIVFSSSCKRKYECFCTISGPDMTRTTSREFVGYTKTEATKLCQAEEYASNALSEVKCILR